MAETVKVSLNRGYLWHDEHKNLLTYGPGDVPIPREMARGLVKAGVLTASDIGEKEEEVHPRILAQRESDVSARIVAAASKVAKRFGLDEQAEALKVKDEDAGVQQLLRNEAAADFLEALAKAKPTGQRDAEEEVLVRLEAIDGIGPKTVELIRGALTQPGPKGSPALHPEGSRPDAAVGPVTVETVEIVPPEQPGSGSTDKGTSLVRPLGPTQQKPSGKPGQ